MNKYSGSLSNLKGIETLLVEVEFLFEKNLYSYSDMLSIFNRLQISFRNTKYSPRNKFHNTRGADEVFIFTFLKILLKNS